MGFEMNSQQELCAKALVYWWNSRYKQTFEISGSPGTGKTTLVYYLIHLLNLNPRDVLFMAYVGKAAMALARKGNFAKTIHSSIYKLEEKAKLDDDGKPMIKNNRVVTIPNFVKKDELEPNIKLIVVDEGSMPNKQISTDILSYGIPVIVLGDLNQLPPVFGNPYFLIKPDFVLTEIMRQQKDDPIIRLSQMALKGERIRVGKYGPKCFVINKSMITDKMLIKSDIVICSKNKTRDRLNRYVRESILKIDKPYPTIGEKIICRQNNWNKSLSDNIFLINGLIGYVENTYIESYNKSTITIDFRPEFLESEMFENLVIDYKYLFATHEERLNSKRSYNNRFEFANAITVHLSQGSQYNNVLIYDEKMGNRDFNRKLLYTAVSRAVYGLILAVD